MVHPVREEEGVKAGNHFGLGRDPIGGPRGPQLAERGVLGPGRLLASGRRGAQAEC